MQRYGKSVGPPVMARMRKPQSKKKVFWVKRGGGCLAADCCDDYYPPGGFSMCARSFERVTGQTLALGTRAKFRLVRVK